MNNSSNTNSDYEEYESLRKLILIIQLTEVIGMTCANTLVITFYMMVKKCRRKLSNFLLQMQAMTDLYNTIMVWLDIAISMCSSHEYSVQATLALISTWMLEYSFILSLGTLMLASFERYIAIRKPYYHRTKITKIGVKYCMFAVWIASLIPPTILLSLMRFDYMNYDINHVITYSFVFDAVMLSMIICVVTSLLLTLMTAKSSIGNNELIELSERQRYRDEEKNMLIRQNSNRKKVRLVVIFLCMMTAYIVTFLPMVISRLMYDTGVVSKHLSQYQIAVLVSVCHTLYESSALFNPLLTLFFKEDYRRIVER